MSVLKTMKVRRKHGISLLVLLLTLLVWVGQDRGWFDSQATVTMQPGLYKIARFIDGDTIAVDMNGRAETIRFIGVDTPETHKPNTPVQCYGPAAAAFTKSTIGEQRVRLGSDPESTDRDRYDRLLRYVYLPDGRLLNKELISQGYGFAYTSFPFTKKADFSAAQDQARAQKRGLWGNCHPYREANGRWQSNDLR